MKVIDLIKTENVDRFFILDSHQEAMAEQSEGHRHDDSDFVGYSYNIHHFNQLKPGSVFLYRRPGTLAPDKRFHIYGGGIVDRISSPDPIGNVIAYIKLGFKFTPAIDQGEKFIEEYEWKTRKKPGPGWKGFWINYGMNEIVAEDFWALIEGRECILCDNQLSGVQTAEENYPVQDINAVFTLTIPLWDEHKLLDSSMNLQWVSRKIDFNQFGISRKTLGTIGKLLVLEFERDRLVREGINRVPEYVAETIGDGLGYDIKSFDSDGREVHIAVKTTRASLSDNFYISKREIEESRNRLYKYKIYRVYSFDEELKKAKLKIYEGDITESKYILEPNSFMVRVK